MNFSNFFVVGELFHYKYMHVSKKKKNFTLYQNTYIYIIALTLAAKDDGQYYSGQNWIT